MSSATISPPKSSPVLAIIAVVLAALASSALLFFHFFEVYPTLATLMSWMPWQIYVVIMLVWLPFFIIQTINIARSSPAFALFFVLIVSQSLHFIEHIAQMTQIHLLGLSGMQAHGLIGMLDLEWVHFIFDGIIIPVFTIALLVPFRSNPWLWLLLPLALWHATEHFFIMHYYLQTGIAGSPGLLSQGGLINGGLPITRPDLHFLYNLAEETLMLLGFFHVARSRRRAAQRQPAPAVVVAPASMVPEAVPVNATPITFAEE